MLTCIIYHSVLRCIRYITPCVDLLVVLDTLAARKFIIVDEIGQPDNRRLFPSTIILIKTKFFCAVLPRETNL